VNFQFITLYRNKRLSADVRPYNFRYVAPEFMAHVSHKPRKQRFAVQPYSNGVVSVISLDERPFLEIMFNFKFFS
jgi:hypothetical protein